MDDPAPSSDPGKSTPPPPDTPPGPVGKQKSVELPSKQKDGTNPDERPAPKSAWERWQEHTLSDRVMAYFTGVVALCAVIQIWILIGGSGQTDKLIRAAQMSAHSADHNAAAAQSFAESARSINQGVNDAVDRLQAQARVAELARETAREASEKALQATIDNFHLDQRAWVGVDQIETLPAPPQVTKSLQVSVIFRNTGKTPAFDVTASGASDPEDRGGRPQPRFVYNSSTVYGMIAPNGAAFTSVNVSRLPIPEARFNELLSGSKIIFIHGRLTYNDAFGEAHWADYCFQLLPDLTTFASCHEHNDADHRAKKQ